jgi:hypothetical protein
VKRRDFLLAIGAVAALPLAPRVAQFAWDRIALAYPPAGGLSVAHLAIVSAVADTIIPRTDTPGATDVGVPEWVDVIVAEHYTLAQRAVFLGGLDAIDALAMHSNGTALSLNGMEQRERVLAILDRPNAYEKLVGRLEHSRRFARAMTHIMERDTLERLMTPLAQRARAYSRLKALVVHGYFTSEHVHRHVLMAEVMPGHFDGDSAHVPSLCRGRIA